ncbi:MAG: 3-oxoacyl-ACP reductase FabG [Clostridia bacterium]|nr:3-oxoacyl-ACP reductase FabG [Clostridia bacterium]
MKTALVTGGTRGIGKAIAEAFLEKGYEVAIIYHEDDDAAMETQNEFDMLGYHPVLMKADLSSEVQAGRVFDEFFGLYGKLDVLVNNAGMAMETLIQDMTAADWDRIFAVNVRSVFLCTRAVVKRMVREGEGSIINIASIWGEVGAANETAYSATKGAVIAYTKAVAKELAPSNVRVNCVSPGAIDTRMMAGFTDEEIKDLLERIPLGRLGSGEDVAKACLYLCEDTYVTGEVLSVGGGFSK